MKVFVSLNNTNLCYFAGDTINGNIRVQSEDLTNEVGMVKIRYYNEVKTSFKVTEYKT